MLLASTVMPLLFSASMMSPGQSGFVANAGQFDPRARFASRGPLHTWVLDDGFISQWADVDGEDGIAVRFTFEGAAAGEAVGVDPLPGVHHYYLGPDPRRWATGVRSYRRVARPDIARGVDLVLRLDGAGLVYDLILDHAALAAEVMVRVDGADDLAIDPDGALLVRTAIGTLRHSAPVTYAVEADGGRHEVPSRFRLVGPRRFGLSVDAPPDSPVTIDPKVLYVTHLGGSVGDEILDVAADPEGLTAVCGVTTSPDFPVTPGTFPASTESEGFVTVLNETGTDALFSTYFGGAGFDRASGVRFAVDADGAVDLVVVGTTTSDDLPISGGAFQSNLAGVSDHYVARFDMDGTLKTSTYLGGSGSEAYWGEPRLAIDAHGRALVGGTTDSADFPVTSGAVDKVHAITEGYVARFNTAGALSAATFLGGEDIDRIAAIAVHPGNGDVFVTGTTSSPDFPSFAGAASSSFFGADAAFLARLQPNGGAIIRSTFLRGGEDRVYPADVSMAANGDVLVGGAWANCNFGSYECFSSAFVERYTKSLKVAVFQSVAPEPGGHKRVFELPTGDVLASGNKLSDHYPNGGRLNLFSADGQALQSLPIEGIVGTASTTFLSYRLLAALGAAGRMVVIGLGTKEVGSVTSIAFDPVSDAEVSQGLTEPFAALIELEGDDGFTDLGGACSNGADELHMEGVGSTVPGFPLELRFVDDAPLPAVRLLLVGTSPVSAGQVGGCPLGLTPILTGVVGGVDQAVVTLILPASVATSTLLAQLAWADAGSLGVTNVVELRID